MSQSDKKTPQTKKAWFIENVLSLLAALLIVFIIRSSIIEAYKIPSGSMMPTLHIGDHIFVNKFAYGLKLPFSDLFADEPIYLVKRDLPKRGDVIVFIYPRDESLFYIKRVIGVPGDIVEMKNKILTINEQPVQLDAIAQAKAKEILRDLNDPTYPESNMSLYTEQLGPVEHTLMIDNTKHVSENFGPIRVPKDKLFVMGDNRDWSGDSRFWGFVPMRNVKGKAMVIWLSLWASISEGSFSFKPGRTGTLIH